MPIDPDHLQKLHDAATPGEWETYEDQGGVVSIWTNDEDARPGLNGCVAFDTEDGDAALIVYLRNHVAEIVEALEFRRNCEESAHELGDYFDSDEAVRDD